MSMTRVLSGAASIPILFVIVWLLPPLYFMALAAVATVIGLHELYAMAKARGISPLAATGTAIGVLIVINAYRPLFVLTGGPQFWIVLGVLAVTTMRLFARRPVEGAIEDIATTLFGVLYVAMLFGYQVGIHAGQGKRWLVFLYLVIWASDTGAYYAGTALGRRRLYEKISPKKSVEGLAAGVLASALVAVLCSLWLVPSLGWIEAVAVGAILAVIGTVGDLVESLLKRSAGLKDSGTLIPGHGGILDRMDSMLFAAPVLYYYLRMR